MQKLRKHNVHNVVTTITIVDKLLISKFMGREKKEIMMVERERIRMKKERGCRQKKMDESKTRMGNGRSLIHVGFGKRIIW